MNMLEQLLGKVVSVITVGTNYQLEDGVRISLTVGFLTGYDMGIGAIQVTNSFGGTMVSNVFNWSNVVSIHENPEVTNGNSELDELKEISESINAKVEAELQQRLTPKVLELVKNQLAKEGKLDHEFMRRAMNPGQP